MLAQHPAIQQTEDGLILRIYVQTCASKDEIVGFHDDAIKVRITAPPVEGKANKHLLAFLAHVFAVNKQQVSLISGDSHRQKRIRIFHPELLPAKLEM